MAKNDWDPELYLKYSRERLQPSIDLVSRIDIENPERIIDIGCGPGNSTQILRKRWLNSHITGIDKSESMISIEKLTNDSEKMRFENMVLESIKSDYPIQKNNKVLFPFNRLFFIGYK